MWSLQNANVKKNLAWCLKTAKVMKKLKMQKLSKSVCYSEKTKVIKIEIAKVCVNSENAKVKKLVCFFI